MSLITLLSTPPRVGKPPPQTWKRKPRRSIPVPARAALSRQGSGARGQGLGVCQIRKSSLDGTYSKNPHPPFTRTLVPRERERGKGES